jgi:hypothetical protein
MKVEGVCIGEISHHLFPQLDSVCDSGTLHILACERHPSSSQRVTNR